MALPSHGRRLRALAPLLVASAIATAGCELDRKDPSAVIDSSAQRGSLPVEAPDSAVDIRALLVDPSIPDSVAEWIELRNPGRTDIDLTGWRLESGGDAGFTFPAGTRIASGGRLDLGRSRDPAKTGGVGIGVIVTGVSLDNQNDWVALRMPDGRTMDSVAWVGSTPDMPLTHRPARPGPKLPLPDTALLP